MWLSFRFNQLDLPGHILSFAGFDEAVSRSLDLGYERNVSSEIRFANWHCAFGSIFIL